MLLNRAKNVVQTHTYIKLFLLLWVNDRDSLKSYLVVCCVIFLSKACFSLFEVANFDLSCLFSSAKVVNFSRNSFVSIAA